MVMWSIRRNEMVNQMLGNDLTCLFFRSMFVYFAENGFTCHHASAF